MLIARVRGTVVSTHKSPSMEGLRLLLLEKIDPVGLAGKEIGRASCRERV